MCNFHILNTLNNTLCKYLQSGLKKLIIYKKQLFLNAVKPKQSGGGEFPSGRGGGAADRFSRHPPTIKQGHEYLLI